MDSSSRKRKRVTAPASSPAPSDPGTTTDLLPTSRADLSSRPILSISRGPIFIPIADGSEWCRTDMIGVNRIGYRYIPAGINPQGFATPCRTIESNPTAFRVSWEDRSPYLKVTKDGLGIAGSKGFRSARCNAPIREGKWYMEVKILHGGGERVSELDTLHEGSHVRLGWGRREAPLNAPVGLDGYSYGYRDKTGDKVTLSRPRPYGRPFKTGDVVGMYISLPPRKPPNPKDPHDPTHLKRERIPIDLKGQEVFEILEYPQSKEMAALMDYSGKSTTSSSLPSSKKPSGGKLPERTTIVTTTTTPAKSAPSGATNAAASSSSKHAHPPTVPLRPLPILPGSRIAFFVNGTCQGTAFSDLYDYLPLRQSATQRKAKDRKRTREGVKEHRENPFDDGTLGYYPFISLFNDASVRLNPGPEFEFPPPDDIDSLLDGPGVGAPQPNPEADSTAPEVGERKGKTWRPTSERYPEFMAEEWAFDALEESLVKADALKTAAADKIEEEKRKAREKKRLQAEARRKAKKAAAEGVVPVGLGAEDQQQERSLLGGNAFGGGLGAFAVGVFNPTSNHPSPSPLRQATSAYEQEEEEPQTPHVKMEEGEPEAGEVFDPEPGQEHSPAPTFTSYGGHQSGYNSDNPDNEHEQLPEEEDEDNGMDVDQELERFA